MGRCRSVQLLHHHADRVLTCLHPMNTSATQMSTSSLLFPCCWGLSSLQMINQFAAIQGVQQEITLQIWLAPILVVVPACTSSRVFDSGFLVGYIKQKVSLFEFLFIGSMSLLYVLVFAIRLSSHYVHQLKLLCIYAELFHKPFSRFARYFMSWLNNWFSSARHKGDNIISRYNRFDRCFPILLLLHPRSYKDLRDKVLFFHKNDWLIANIFLCFLWFFFQKYNYCGA
jgi:hypothetical protein